MNAMQLIRLGRDLLKDRKGVTALEYGLIAAIMGAAIVAAFGIFSGDLSTLFNNLSSTLTTPPGGTTP